MYFIENIKYNIKLKFNISKLKHHVEYTQDIENSPGVKRRIYKVLSPELGMISCGVPWCIVVE